MSLEPTVQGVGSSLPRTIWFLWLQGREEMPWAVRRCCVSWEVRNPGWDFVFLDRETLAEYLIEQIASASPSFLTMQAYSDAIRVNLLREYGGVWVDATCFCSKPLDSWIAPQVSEGFFAFRSPGGRRLLSSWFLAATRNSYVVECYAEAVNRYMAIEGLKDSLCLDMEQRLIRFLELINVPNSFLVSSFFSKLTRKYPYFWFHYIFESLYLHDAEFRRAWDLVPHYSADGPHGILFHGIYEEADGPIKDEIDQGIVPLYKLVWDIDTNRLTESCAINYLLDTLHEER
ncbi:MAG: capsular polysaccharide synthesis protein [Sedimenticola sp.]